MDGNLSKNDIPTKSEFHSTIDQDQDTQLPTAHTTAASDTKVEQHHQNAHLGTDEMADDDNDDSTIKKSKKDKKDKKDKKSKKDKKDKKGEKKDKRTKIKGELVEENPNLSSEEELGKRKRTTIQLEASDMNLDLDGDFDDGFVYDDAKPKKDKKKKGEGRERPSGPMKRSRQKSSKRDGSEDDEDYSSAYLTEYDIRPAMGGAIDQTIDESKSFNEQFFQKQRISKQVLQAVRNVDTHIDLQSPELLASVDGLIYQMQLAACIDREILSTNIKASETGSPSDPRRPIYRKSLFPYITRELSKPKELLSIFLEHGLMHALRLWLLPEVSGNLPPAAMRKPLYDVLLRLPVEPSHFESAPLGEVVIMLLQHPHETDENRTVLKKVVQKWARLALRTSATPSSEHMLISHHSQAHLDSQIRALHSRTKALDAVNTYNIPSNAEFLQAKRPSMALRDVVVLPRGLLDSNQIQSQKKKEKAKKSRSTTNDDEAEEVEDDDE